MATTDKSLVAPIVNCMPLYMRVLDGQIATLRTPAHLQASFDLAIGPSPIKIITLVLDLSMLHFTPIPNHRNFADMSKDPLPTPKAPASTTASSAPAGGIAVPPGSLPVTDVFNYNALPSDVRLQLDQHTDPSKMMTCSTMEIEIELLIPDPTLDPTGNNMCITLS